MFWCDFMKQLGFCLRGTGWFQSTIDPCCLELPMQPMESSISPDPHIKTGLISDWLTLVLQLNSTSKYAFCEIFDGTFHCEEKSRNGTPGKASYVHVALQFDVCGLKINTGQKTLNNKVLPYSTGDCFQYPVINHNGKEYEKEHTYIYIHIYNWVTLLNSRN